MRHPAVESDIDAEPAFGGGQTLQAATAVLCWTVRVPIDPDSILDDFGAVAALAAVEGWPCVIRTEILRAPHRHPPLPAGFGAVYVFALGDTYGSVSAIRHARLATPPIGRHCRSQFASLKALRSAAVHLRQAGSVDLSCVLLPSSPPGRDERVEVAWGVEPNRFPAR